MLLYLLVADTSMGCVLRNHEDMILEQEQALERTCAHIN